ncbi:unnamed protein product [Symbiodinium sp. CCMP2592]|nr:unnamed protein product [Symbiodinium sp. CCMP2592]
MPFAHESGKCRGSGRARRDRGRRSGLESLEPRCLKCKEKLGSMSDPASTLQPVLDMLADMTKKMQDFERRLFDKVDELACHIEARPDKVGADSSAMSKCLLSEVKVRTYRMDADDSEDEVPQACNSSDPGDVSKATDRGLAPLGQFLKAQALASSLQDQFSSSCGEGIEAAHGPSRNSQRGSHRRKELLVSLKNGWRWEGACHGIEDGRVILGPAFCLGPEGLNPSGRWRRYVRRRPASVHTQSEVKVKLEEIDLIKPLERVGEDMRCSVKPQEVMRACKLGTSALCDEEEPLVGSRLRPVRIHIYDVGEAKWLQMMNQVLAPQCCPWLGLGGAFHCGVEVDGLEWCYGAVLSRSTAGIGCVDPMQCPGHHYRQTVDLGCTDRSTEDIAQMISEMVEEYPGTAYDLFSRNCCHFAHDFARRLGVRSVPGWVSLRLAACCQRLEAMAGSLSWPFQRAELYNRCGRTTYTIGQRHSEP